MGGLRHKKMLGSAVKILKETSSVYNSCWGEI